MDHAIRATLDEMIFRTAGGRWLLDLRDDIASGDAPLAALTARIRCVPELSYTEANYTLRELISCVSGHRRDYLLVLASATHHRAHDPHLVVRDALAHPAADAEVGVTALVGVCNDLCAETSVKSLAAADAAGSCAGIAFRWWRAQQRPELSDPLDKHRLIVSLTACARELDAALPTAAHRALAGQMSATWSGSPWRLVDAITDVLGAPVAGPGLARTV